MLITIIIILLAVWSDYLYTARVAYGVEVMLGAFRYGTKRPLKDLHVLDAGIALGLMTQATG